MGPDQLRQIFSDVAARAVRDGLLPDGAQAGPPAGPLFRPVDARSAGVVADWVSPVAQRWAPLLGLEPRRLARVLAQGLTEQGPIGAVEVTPAGLLAITLTDLSRAEVIDTVLADDGYGLGADAAVSAAQLPTSTGDDAPLQQGDPLRFVQEAHARLCRVVRNAQALGVSARAVGPRDSLTHVSERRLQVALADLPQRLATGEGNRAQQVRALTDLAELCDANRHAVRPMLADADVEPVHGVRLALAQAAARVLRNGLARLGAAAPERM
ncbi:anticodon-binding protein [Humibacillus sp. DSM 29435]|uniref:DALR anticodon-binding domain-containing protein n=1 Tax=Humibacillus sp. DSM 29435 TaxID=1869167 RepID=UPI00087313AC|nr:DALR anticodon-binding domain-containing protein [Humibacillus sp. DSM 29435]OFE14632.1 anticodon-binding protein [Humibacillus sp. DSM 29435]